MPASIRPARTVEVMRRPLIALPLLGTLLLGVCLAGCGDDPEAAPPPGPARTTGSPAAAPTKYDEYVALGDSYTAAPLVPPTDTSTTCLRSGVNYPALGAEAMAGTALTDVSCSGAATQNMMAPQRGATGAVPPQFDALKPDTDLVSIGLGGNDGALFGTMLVRCTSLAADDPQGSPCSGELGPTLDSTLAQIQANLTTVVSFGLLATAKVPALAAVGLTVAPGALLSLLLAAAFARAPAQDAAHRV